MKDSWINAISFFVLCSLILSVFGFIGPGDENNKVSELDRPEGSRMTFPDRPRNEITHDWPMAGRDMYHTNYQQVETRGIEDVKIKWDNGGDALTWATVVGDFSRNIQGPAPDERQHVVYATNTDLLVTDGATGDTMWSLDIEALNQSSVGDIVTASPVIADFDMNGKIEIAFLTDNNPLNLGTLYVFEPNITFDGDGYHWDEVNNTVADRRLEYIHSGNVGESSPVSGDINNDGRDDVVLTMGMELIAYDVYNNATIYEYDKIEGNRVSAPVLLTYSPNDLRSVITSRDGSSLNIYMIDHNGNTAWNRSIAISSVPSNGPVSFLPSPAVGEIDLIQDGPEIVVLTPFENGNGKVRVYSKDGDEIWPFPFEAEGQFDSSPALADVDGDMLSEIGVVSWKADLFPNRIESHAYLLDDGGSLLWDYSKNETVGIGATIATPVFAHVNEDNNPDMVFTTTNTVTAVNSVDGELIWEILPQSGILSSSPAAGDFDNDDFLDIAMEGFILSNKEIDLTLNLSDISFGSTIIYEGVEVGITAMIHNLEEDDAENVDVRFYENIGGLKLIGNTTLGSVPAEDTRQAIVDWTPSETGNVEITVEIDHADKVPETDEDNNYASIYVDVREALPDLEITNVDFKRHDLVKVDNETTHLVEGEESYINITVTNSGLIEADTCILFLKVDQDVLIDRADLGTLAPGKFKYRKIPYIFSEGNVNVNISLDPDGTLQESNSTNNYYEIELEVIDDDPEDASYVIEGHVYTSEVLIASDAQVRALNDATVEQLVVYSDSNGAYSLDLADLENGYMEGDEINVFASKGNESYSTKIYAYSEDMGIVKNIILERGVGHGFEMSFDGPSVRTAPPGIAAGFTIEVMNTGDEENTIVFNEKIVIVDENGENLYGWSPSLSSDQLILGTGSSGKVNLTVEVPDGAKIGSEAHIGVTAHSDDDENEMRTLTAVVEVNLSGSFILSSKETDKSIILPDKKTSVVFEYTLMNTGDSSDGYSVDVKIEPDELDVEYEDKIELMSGEIIKKDITLKLDKNTRSGIYGITLNITSDSLMTNAELHFYLEVGKPDLSISENDISISPGSPQLGDEVTVSCKLLNKGGFDLPSFTVKLTGSGSASTTAQEQTAGPIFSGKNNTVRFKINLTSYGLFGLTVALDPNDDISETNEGNNEAGIEIDLRPDIVIKSMKVTSSPKSIVNLTLVNSKDEVYLKVVLMNPTDVDVDLPFTVEVGDSPKDAVEKYGSNSVDEAIYGGGELTVSIKLDLEDARGGELTIHVIADAGKEITERDENNNVLSITFDIEEEEKADDGKYTSTEKGLFLLGGSFIIVIVILLVKRRKRDRSEDYDDDDEDDEDVITVEPVAVETIDEEKDGNGKKSSKKKGKGHKRKRSLQELVSSLEKTIEEKEEESEEDGGGEMDISDMIEGTDKGDIEAEITEMLDMDGSESVEQDDEDFLDSLRGEMRGMKL